MDDNKNIKEEKEDLIDEEIKEEELIEEDSNEELKEENITREINLDDLYDGAINNTVIIDPITNNEILLATRKPNYTIVGIIIAVIILLLLYFVNIKTNLVRSTREVEPKTTTTKKVVIEEEKKSGTLLCTYSSKSDAESQSVSFEANYEEDILTNSKFNYAVTSNTDTASAIIKDLTNQYESFFINNAAVVGNNVTFNKTDKGFTFTSLADYKNLSFDSVTIEEGKTILYVKPTKEDTVKSLQEAYIDKGFNCAITNKDEIK